MSDISRRGLIGGALALGGVSMVPLACVALGKSETPAHRFFNSVGICTHPNWRKTVWGQTAWESAFGETGVVNMRGKIGSGSAGTSALRHLRGPFDDGVRICVPIAEDSGGDFDLAATQASLDFLADKVGVENVSGIESANEYNSPRRRPPDWAPRLRRFQDWLHDTVRSNRAFDSVPLIAPSMWGRLTNDYRAIGNLRPNVDRGCLHYYTGGRRPTRMGAPSKIAEIGGLGESTVERAIADAGIVAPGLPVWVTEFGYRTAGPGADTRGDVSESVATKYLLRGLFDLFAQGAEKTFIYTLIDDAHRRPPVYHGLLDSALRPRPAFHALRNLMSLFRDEGPVAAAEPPSYKLSGATPAVKHHGFSKSDGSFLVVLYQDVDSYDRWTRSELDVAPDEVEVTLGQPAKVELFDPAVSDAPFRTIPGAGSFMLPVGDAVVVAKLSGAPAPKA